MLLLDINLSWQYCQIRKYECQLKRKCPERRRAGQRITITFPCFRLVMRDELSGRAYGVGYLYKVVAAEKDYFFVPIIGYFAK